MGTTDQQELRVELARVLDNARKARQPVGQLTTTHRDLDAAVAYQVQQVGIDMRMDEGARRVGRKIGLTSQAMQRQLGVGEPDYGTLLDCMVLPSGSTIDVADLIAPRVEAEIAVTMGRSLHGAGTTREEAEQAVGAVVPALEIIDSRIAGWKIALADTIADNASSGLAVVGSPVEVAASSDLASQAVTLFEDDVVVGRGDGAALLGDPWESLLWLVRALAGHDASLEAGDLVLLGAVHASVPLQRGKRYRAVYSTWGQAEFLAH
jgi:2-keto-4-pentenoate hydratase